MSCPASFARTLPPLAAAALASLLLSAPPAAAAGIGPGCGVETPCAIAGGEYRIRLPQGRAPKGAIIFLHGWSGTAEAEMRNTAWARLAERLGVAFVAPQGEGGTWSYPGAPRQLRDEFAFFRALAADLKDRFGISGEKTVLTGFSMGGSMTWNIACREGELFAGYVAVAGAFWDPVPEACPSPVPMLVHVHGTADKTVPLEGRAIGEHWRQSDVAKSLALWQRKAGVAPDFPKDAPAQGLACQMQEAGNGRGLLEMCLHSGGHSIRAEWVEEGWQLIAQRRGWAG